MVDWGQALPVSVVWAKNARVNKNWVIKGESRGQRNFEDFCTYLAPSSSIVLTASMLFVATALCIAVAPSLVR